MFPGLQNLLRRVGGEEKASRTGSVIALHQAGRPVWTPRDYATLTREGFVRNAVVFRCVRTIAEAAGSAPLVLYENGKALDEHPLLDLLARPNARQSGAVFLEALAGHLLVAGNAYAEMVAVDGAPRELHALRPDRMKVVPGPDGWPEAYEYSVGAETVRFRQDAAVPPVLHLAFFHPLDDHYGFSPLEAAAQALDVHNAASAWNKALLDNAARPSGALVYAGPEGANLTDDQFERLKEELDSQFSGPRNAGRPLLLDGGLDWKAMALTPKDMDFMQAKNGAAREIALAFGVPPMLLGIPGDNTYANYQEANRALWRQTVLPLLGRVLGDIAHWLGPAFGEAALRVEPDLDRIEALSSDREALWRRVEAASFLTDEEKRQAVGYGSGS
ncbi:phage portal protein [Flaviflagellibacter deserti]|uniref:Phage portal protein n=1 Tax=Flaviflagellibacter deserti TaxID=2267266 RepID=A0ABV9Z027_9HYPH